MSRPKITIAIPTYDRAAYLGQAIESALAQDYPELEVIVSDNASTDGTEEIVKRYLSDPRLVYHRQRENSGAKNNWQKLLYEYAAGDWVMFLGSDDHLLDRSYISRCLEIIMNEPDCVLCHANMRFYHENNRRAIDTDKRCPRLTDGSWYFWDAERSELIHINNLLFKRSAAIEAAVFQKDYIGGDAELIGKLLLLGKVGFVDQVATVYRVHDDSDTRTASLERILNNYDCYEDIYAFALKRHPELRSRLAKMRKIWLGRFFKAFLFNLLKHDRKKAWSFAVKSIRAYPREVLPVLFQPRNLIAFVIGLTLGEAQFRKALGQYSQRRP